MIKQSILKFLVYLALSFAGQTFAVESDELLQPDDAFQFSATVNKADSLLLSWDIANGYYLYRHKIKVVSLTDGIKVSEQLFPARLNTINFSVKWTSIAIIWKLKFCFSGKNQSRTS